MTTYWWEQRIMWLVQGDGERRLLLAQCKWRMGLETTLADSMACLLDS